MVLGLFSVLAAPFPAASRTAPIRTIPDLILREPGQDKDLHVRVSYPASAGLLPVVIFSHGHSNSKDGYRPLTEFWAAHGFLVLQPTHLDSRDLQPDSRLKALDPTRSRFDDVEFLIDSLPEIARRIPALVGRIDPARVAIAGHSQGAMTAQLIAGAETFGSDGQAKSWRDPRVSAALLLAPQGEGRAFRESSWNHYALPTLVVTGTQDGTVPQNSPPDWQAAPFRRSLAGDKYWLRLEGAGHDMGDIYDDGEIPEDARDPDMVHMVQTVTEAFLDHYLAHPARSDWPASLKGRIRQGKAEADLASR